MKLVDKLRVDHIGTHEKTVALTSGTISSLPTETPADYLLISSKPNDYSERQGGALKELFDMGISVETLEKTCEMDFRPLLPCWVSKPLTGTAFKRLVVFEPDYTSAQQSINTWKAFQAIRVFSGSNTSSKITAVLFSSGDEAMTLSVRLRMMTYAAASLAARTEASDINILVSAELEGAASAEFKELKQSYAAPPQLPSSLKREIDRIQNVNPEFKDSLRSQGVPPEEVGLTARQYEAIYNYTNFTYFFLNKVLRRGDIADPEYALFHSTIEAVSTGLSQLTKNQANDIPVARGLESFEGIENIYKVGNTAREAAYTSTTRKTDPQFSGNYVLRILGKIGKDVELITAFPGELEVLFDSATDHLIHGVNLISGETPTTEVLSGEMLPNTSNIYYSHL